MPAINVNPAKVPAGRPRRVATIKHTLQARDGDGWATLNIVTDEIQSAAAANRQIDHLKFGWERIGYFGDAPLRIVTERLVPKPVAVIDVASRPQVAIHHSWLPRAA